jgi:RNA polymerase sigma factor (sigma-70 family)
MMIDISVLEGRRQAARRLTRTWSLPPAIDVEDLEQAGVVGVLMAAPRFRSDRGATLRTFTRYRMVGAMRDAIRAAHPLCPAAARAQRCELLPIDAAANVAAPAAVRPDRIYLLAQLLATLPPRWRFVLEQCDLWGLSQADVARALGITPARVSQLRTQAFAHLRKKVA